MTRVRDEINALFSWNPPYLTHTPKSTATRPPSFYDKHFCHKFVLKRVVRLPSLVQDLTKNVDKALEYALETLPPLNPDLFVTAKARVAELRNLTKRVSDEIAVADFYHLTTARYCTPVASTLTLHPKASFSEWQSLLYWTKSNDPPTDYAIMDGQLRILEEGDGWAAIVESMEDEDRRIFEEMEKSASPLATWEMKSTGAGPVVMNAVLNLGEFNWTFCKPSGVCRSRDVKARNDVAKVRVGSDAKDPLWNLPSSDTFLDPENHDEETDIQPVASSSTTTLQRRVTQRATLSAVSGSSMPPPPPPPSTSRSLKHGSPTEVQGKKRKRNNDVAYQDPHEKTARSLAQQAWAQAVKVDGTLIVLHSGNHELVCVRHRDSQTLYVSNVIEPPTCKPGYGKLHVGIYIAAVQDAMSRWKQKSSGDDQDDQDQDQDDQNQDQDQDDQDQDDQDQDDQDYNEGSGSGRKRGSGRGRNQGAGRGRRRSGHRVGKRKSGGFQRSAGRKTPPDDELGGIEKTIHAASNRSVVLLYLQYDVYDSPIPASFLRSAPSIMARPRCPTPRFSLRAIRTHGPEECLTIVLTSEIGRGSTGVVHRGTLEVCDRAMPLDVVVKLAFDTGQRDTVKSEYKVYRRLRSNGVLKGIPTVLGLFDDSEGAACALVMLYAGNPLVKEPQHILSVSDCKSALLTLESIHHAGMLHGDIRRDNILMGDSGLTIIDFGHSEQCNNQGAKDNELAQLRYLLGLARESD